MHARAAPVCAGRFPHIRASASREHNHTYWIYYVESVICAMLAGPRSPAHLTREARETWAGQTETQSQSQKAKCGELQLGRDSLSLDSGRPARYARARSPVRAVVLALCGRMQCNV